MASSFLNIDKNTYVSAMQGFLKLHEEFLEFNSSEEITQEQRKTYQSLKSVFPEEFSVLSLMKYILKKITIATQNIGEQQKNEVIDRVISESYNDLEVIIAEQFHS